MRSQCRGSIAEDDTTCPGGNVRNEFTAIIEQDGDWFIAYCPEIPGANGQGRTRDECRENLIEAIALILEDRREDALRGVPDNALREVVVVE
jgi:predicted RNase H-like HicB family nuclease